MAQFETDSSSNPLGTYWKLYVKNHTSSWIDYDFSMCLGYPQHRSVSGSPKGRVQPGQSASYNFDLVKSSNPNIEERWLYPNETNWPILTFPRKKVLNPTYIAASRARSRWLGFSVPSRVTTIPQYLYFTPVVRCDLKSVGETRGYDVNTDPFLVKLRTTGGDYWKRTTHSDSIDVVYGYGNRVTVDGGGHSRSTLNIYFQAYGQ